MKTLTTLILVGSWWLLGGGCGGDDRLDADADGDGDADSDGDLEVDADADSKRDAERDCVISWIRDSRDPFADEVTEFTPAEGATFGADRFPDIVLGPPEGAGAGAGSFDVLSLGCGGSITVRFDAPFIVDGPGPDFIVFENPFESGPGVFAEPARVSVSADGETFHSFSCAPESLVGCAGQAPVHAASENCLDPTDAAVAGGDAYDLAEVGLSEASHVRIEDRSAENTSSAMWCGGESAGFDLDAVAVVPR